MLLGTLSMIYERLLGSGHACLTNERGTCLVIAFLSSYQ